MKASIYKPLLISFAFFGCLITNAPTYTSEQKKFNIIFDLGGVLLETSKTEFLRQAGIRTAINLILQRQRLMEELSEVQPFTDTTVIACDEQGHQIPPIMCDWLKGVPPEQLLERTAQNNHSLLNFANVMFTPAKFAQTQYLFNDGLQFVQECHNQGHRIYILSNLDAGTYKILYERYKEFFDLFDGIVISGECGLIKPDPAIFTHLLEKYNLKPNTCVWQSQYRSATFDCFI